MAKDRLSMRKLKEVLRLKFDHQLTNRKSPKAALSPTSLWESTWRWPGRPGSPGRFPMTSMTPVSNNAFMPASPRRHLTNRSCRPCSTCSKNSKRNTSPCSCCGTNTNKATRRIPVQLFLRTVSKVAQAIGCQPAPGASRRGKGFHRLCRADRSHLQPGDRQGRFGSPGFHRHLGASNYSYAEATASQKLPDWIKSHIRALEFFGGVPQILVPDNLKSGVTHPCRYEPDVNPTYLDLARHYGITVIPARPGKPKDKAKVESSVLIVERWILAALRNHRFFSLAELNQAISEKLIIFNQRPLQKMKVSREHLFETIDRPALAALPAHPYEFAQWKKAAVNIDYHVEVDRHYYSVPHQLRGKKLDVSMTATTIAVFHKNRRVASHARSHRKYGHTTLAEHMPKAHQRHLQWTPSRIIHWAGKTGPCTQRVGHGDYGA
jgi:transposase